MNVNDGKWFRSMGREAHGAEEREVKMLDDIIVVDNTTGEKMILLNATSTNCDDYYIAVQKNGDVRCGSVDEIKVLLTDEQKKLLEG